MTKIPPAVNALVVRITNYFLVVQMVALVVNLVLEKSQEMLKAL